MKIRPLLMLLGVLGSSAASAGALIDGVKEGAAKAATAVGDVTETAVDVAGKAATTVTDSVASSRQGLKDEATPQETRHKLDRMAETTLERLLAEQPGSRALLDRSAGYAVFDKREASFYVVAGYGRGVAVNVETGARTYMKMATTGAGLSFGLGGFASQVVILFENSGDLERFIVEGLDATAAVDAMAGQDKEQLALRFNEGKAVFVLTGKGWKVAAKLTGSRYWPDDELNHL